jgi:hypothetical protein
MLGLIDDRFQSQGNAGSSDDFYDAAQGKQLISTRPPIKEYSSKPVFSQPDGSFVSNVLDKEPVVWHSLKL